MAVVINTSSWLYCLVELVHWSNAYLIATHSDFLGYGHEYIDISVHTLLQVLFFGVILHNMNPKQLILMGVLRFSLELGYMIFEEEIYGRRLPAIEITTDLPGTCAYVLAELFITLIASLCFKKEDSNNDFIYSIKTNKNNTILIILYHWCYIIAADYYLKSKELYLFHGAHIMNLVLTPIVLPFCKWLKPYNGRQKKEL